MSIHIDAQKVREALRIEEIIDEKLRGIQVPVQPLPILLDLAAFDYTVDIYSDRIVVRDPSGNTTELPSLADLNSWLRNTRDKRILIRAHTYVGSNYLRLTRNKYLILGNFKEISVVEPEVELVLVGHATFINNWDYEAFQYVKLDNASIVVSSAESMSFVSPVPGEVMRLKRLIVLHAIELSVWDVYIEYMYARVESLFVSVVVVEFGYFEVLSQLYYGGSPPIRVEGTLIGRYTMVYYVRLGPGQSQTFSFDWIVKDVIVADLVSATLSVGEPQIAYHEGGRNYGLHVYYPTREASISVSESGITVTNTGTSTQTIYVQVSVHVRAYGGLGVPA